MKLINRFDSWYINEEVSAETSKKMSDAKKGKKNPMHKISLYKKLLENEGKAIADKKHEEYSKKMSKLKIEYWKKHKSK